VVILCKAVKSALIGLAISLDIPQVAAKSKLVRNSTNITLVIPISCAQGILHASHDIIEPIVRK